MSNDTTTSSGQYTPLSQLLGFEPGDYVTIATDKVQRARTITVDELDADYAMDMFEKQDTWIGAQPVKPGTQNKRTKASDVAALRVLYADFDFKGVEDVQQIISAIDQISEQIGAETVSVVKSGGGLHPRWKLAKPIEPADAKGVLGRWQITVQRIAEENGFKADSVFDLPRVLRLPGTVNEKYDPPAPVEILEGHSSTETVPTAAVWSKLDQHPTKIKAKKKTTPPAEAAEREESLKIDVVDMTPAPELPKQSPAVMNERYVGSEVARCTERLRMLEVNGYNGEPWHNTVRDVAFVMAKIGLSPETSLSIDEVEQIFRDAAPNEDDHDKKDDWERDVDTAWDSACEAAEGEIFEMVGSGDEIFAEDMDAMVSGVDSINNRPLDIDPALSLDDLGAPAPAPAPLSSALERFKALPLPLVPGFNGVAAVRTLAPPEPVSPSHENRLRVLGEDIADMHEYEHGEYMHPHCPVCFPDAWRLQLNRWLVRNPGKDPSAIHPPMGRLAPGEGYLNGAELLGLADSEMLINGILPTNATGLIVGRGGGGKTFTAVDLAMHVLNPECTKWKLAESSAEDTFGDVSEHGDVMMLAGEGFRGMKSRLRSWLKHYGYGDTPATAPEWFSRLTIREEVPNFFSGGEDFELMLEEIREKKPRLIIVDTLQKASAGADQNSASDMSEVHSRLSRVKTASDGGTVIVIAHSTKDDSSARGSSALEDDSDFVIHVTAGKGDRPSEIEVTKSRDSEKPAPVEFYLTPVGNSVVVTSTRPVSAGELIDEREKVEVLTAMAILDQAKSGAEATMAEITRQTRGVEVADIYSLFARELMPKGLVVQTSSSGNKYTITEKGKIWLSTRSASLFAQTKGYS